MTEQTLNEARLKMASFLKARREDLGLSQQEVADMTGMGRRTVQRAENGQLWMSMKQFFLFCWAVHIFPTAVEMESDTPIAEALRSTWQTNDKAMSVQEALKLKAGRYLGPEHIN